MFANLIFGDLVKDKSLILAGGWTPLNLNAFHGHAYVVDTLIAAGADVNEQEVDGWGPLHHGAHKGHADIVKSLIAAGADLNIKDRYGCSPLHHGVQSGSLDIVNALLAAGADVDASKPNGWTPLFYSGRHKNGDITETLISNGATVNVKASMGWTPLHRTAFDGNIGSVKALIAAGADVVLDESDWSALHYVAQEGYADIAEVLLAAGANVHAKVDVNGWTPLHVAAQNGHAGIVKAFIAAGADVNAKSDDEGWTPLHSLNYGSENIAEALERYGGRENTRKEGQRLIYPLNAGSGHVEIAKLLISAGADVSLGDSQGRTALDPYMSNTIEVSKALIKYALLYQYGSSLNTKLELGDRVGWLAGLLNLPHSRAAQMGCQDDKDLNRFSKECEEQVRKMKETFLGGSSISVFEFIKETDQNKLVLYLTEEKYGINNESSRTSYVEKFSIYAEDLEAQFKLEARRQE